MKLLKKQLSLFILIPSLLIFLIVVTLIFLPYSTFNPDVYEGDKIIRGEGIYKGAEYYSLGQYKAALRSWPILKFNSDFNDKLKKAEALKAEHVKNTPGMILYFKAIPTKESISQITKKLESFAVVKEVEYIPKEEALERYKQLHKNDPSILQLVTPEILPPSMEVFISDWSKLQEIKDSLQDNSDIQDIILSSAPSEDLVF